MRAFVAQTKMELLMSLRQSESLLVTMVIPAVILIFLTQVEIVQLPGSSRIHFLFPGTVAVATMAVSMVSLGIATGFERRHGVLKRLALTPLGRRGLIAAKVSATLILVMIQAILLTLTATALGWRPSDPRASALALGLTLGTTAFAGIGLFLAGTLRAELNLATSNAIFVFMVMAGGAIFPLDRLPSALEGLVRILPLHALSQLLRAGLAGTGLPTTAVLLLAGWATVFPTLAAATFSWD